MYEIECMVGSQRRGSILFELPLYSRFRMKLRDVSTEQGRKDPLASSEETGLIDDNGEQALYGRRQPLT